MAKRKRAVHQSAMPLLNCINSGRLTRAEVAKKLNLDVQNVTNWLARGIPAKQLPEVAALCDLSTDEYRAQAGLGVKTRPDRPENVMAAHGYHSLPIFLQQYVLRKIDSLLRTYNAVPVEMRKKLSPPKNPEQYRQWESEIESVLLRWAVFENGEQQNQIS
ncbi:MAG: hypothetical protein IH604_16245 [Burkholderiales bacterium]|nr:hypothetical protein [Burkholderiales bacterium]